MIQNYFKDFQKTLLKSVQEAAPKGCYHHHQSPVRLRSREAWPRLHSANGRVAGALDSFTPLAGLFMALLGRWRRRDGTRGDGIPGNAERS